MIRAYKILLAMGVPPAKMVLGGGSSGGYHSLKCFEHIVDEDMPKPGGVVINSPSWTPGFLNYVGPKILKDGLAAYQPPSSSAPKERGAEWYAVHLPPTFLANGTGEVLLDYIKEFGDKLREKGMDLTVFVGEYEGHIFNDLESKYSRNKETWGDALDFDSDATELDNVIELDDVISSVDVVDVEGVCITVIAAAVFVKSMVDNGCSIAAALGAFPWTDCVMVMKEVWGVSVLLEVDVELVIEEIVKTVGVLDGGDGGHHTIGGTIVEIAVAVGSEGWKFGSEDAEGPVVAAAAKDCRDGEAAALPCPFPVGSAIVVVV